MLCGVLVLCGVPAPCCDSLSVMKIRSLVSARGLIWKFRVTDAVKGRGNARGRQRSSEYFPHLTVDGSRTRGGVLACIPRTARGRHAGSNTHINKLFFFFISLSLSSPTNPTDRLKERRRRRTDTPTTDTDTDTDGGPRSTDWNRLSAPSTKWIDIDEDEDEDEDG